MSKKIRTESVDYLFSAILSSERRADSRRNVASQRRAGVDV